MNDRDAYSRAPTKTPCKSLPKDGSSCKAEEHRELGGYSLAHDPAQRLDWPSQHQQP